MEQQQETTSNYNKDSSNVDDELSRSNIQYLFNRPSNNRGNNTGNNRGTVWYVRNDNVDGHNEGNGSKTQSEETEEAYSVTESDGDEADTDGNVQHLFNKLSGGINQNGDNIATTSNSTGATDVGATSSSASIQEMFNKLSGNNEATTTVRAKPKCRKISDTVVNYNRVQSRSDSTDASSGGGANSIQQLFNKIASASETQKPEGATDAGPPSPRRTSEDSANIQHLFNRLGGNNESGNSGNSNSGGGSSLYNMFTSRADLLLKHLEEQSK